MKNGLELVSKYRTAIMGFAALCICFLHEWKLVFGDVEFLRRPEEFVHWMGLSGVDIFFFISGMGLTYSIGKRKLSDFYFQRLKRVLFPFVIVAIIRALYEKWTFMQFLGNVTGYNFFAKDVYSLLWFVPAIVILYLLFPFYYKLFQKSSNKVIFTINVIMIWLILLVVFEKHIRQDLSTYFNRIPGFIMGVLFGWLSQNKKIEFTKSTWVMIFIAFISGTYSCYMILYSGAAYNHTIISISNMMMSIPLIFLVAGALEMISRSKYGKSVSKVLCTVLNFFGVMSLELYCVQEWMDPLIIPHFEGKVDVWVINLIVIAILTVCGFVLYMAGKMFWKGVDSVRNKLSKSGSTVN